MTAPRFYIVADCDAFALEDDGMTVFGAPVNSDGNVDWDDAYYFDSYDEDIEYIAHMSNLLVQSAKLYHEHNVEVFTK
jgi:hypothetical protein